MTTTAAAHEHQSEKKPLACPGIDGANPLHFLASLGTFRLLCLHDPEARMRWLSGETWHPEYLTSLDEEAFCNTLAGDFGWDPSVDPATEENAASTKRSGAKRGKGTGGGKKNKGDNDDNDDNDNDDGEQETATEDGGVGAQTMSPRMKKLTTLFPAAFSGQVIERPVAEFRELALRACNAGEAWPGALPLQDELVAAFASDGAVKGGEKTGEIPEIAPSALSFSNGGSGKCLLKDFRNCAVNVSPQSLGNFFRCTGKNEDWVTDLNWDPGSQRPHALQYGDPGDRKNRVPCDATANALAFVGLTMYPSMPGKRGIATVGIVRSGKAWIWPLWKPLLPLAVLRSLCNTVPGEGKGQHLRQEDFWTWLCAERYSLNKRFFFSPSIPVDMAGE
jgi:hypothetical protein